MVAMATIAKAGQVLLFSLTWPSSQGHGIIERKVFAV